MAQLLSLSLVPEMFDRLLVTSNRSQFIPVYHLWFSCSQKRVEDSKWIIRIHISKDRQYNGKTKKDKRTSNNLQNTTNKTKDRATRTTLNSGSKLRCSGMVISSCSNSDTRRA